MKKTVISILVFLFLLTVPGQAQAAEKVITFNPYCMAYLENGFVRPMDVASFIENGRVYVPLRYLAYSLGMSDNNVAWLPSLQTATFHYENKDVTLQVGNKEMLVNTTTRLMDVAPVIRQDRVFLPARYVAEAFGANVTWDQQHQSVLVTWNDGNNNIPQGGGLTLTNPEAEELDDGSVEPPYVWDYKDRTWTWDPQHTQYACNNLIAAYRQMKHPARNDYDYMRTYCVESLQNEKNVLQEITTVFKKGAKDIGYNEIDTVGMVVAFVQSFTYVSDAESTGIAEYPRYPLETLVERQGDCEDFSILTATLIRDLGYSTALIIFEDHCAVGVACDTSWPGSYYEVNGRRYYYLETTDKGWGIGEVPDAYDGKKAKVFPLP